MARTLGHPETGAELLVRDVRPDAKNRVTLGKALAGLGDDVHFDVYRNAEGQIILDPRVSVPASEAWLYRDPEALAAVRRGIREAGEGKAKKLRSFAKHAKSA